MCSLFAFSLSGRVCFAAITSFLSHECRIFILLRYCSTSRSAILVSWSPGVVFVKPNVGSFR